MVPKHIIYAKTAKSYKGLYIGDNGDKAQTVFSHSTGAGDQSSVGWIRNGVLYKNWRQTSVEKETHIIPPPDTTAPPPDTMAPPLGTNE